MENLRRMAANVKWNYKLRTEKVKSEQTSSKKWLRGQKLNINFYNILRFHFHSRIEQNCEAADENAKKESYYSNIQINI